MNRRSFLGNLLAGVAAVVGAGMVAPKAEAAERNVMGAGGTSCPDCASATFPPSVLAGEAIDHTALVQGYIDRGERIPLGEYNISRPLRARGMIAGSGPDKTVLKWTGEGYGEAVVVAEGPGFIANGVLIDGGGRASGVNVGAATTGDVYAKGYLDGLDQQMQGIKRLDVPSAVVVGALYDFMGRLTTLDEPITVSRSHTVYGVMDAFQAWATDRGLDINVADIQHWQERLSVPAETA